MLPGMEMMACPNLAVSPEVMQHIVQVESSANPYAIGVVGGQLQRQPTNLAEALATVQMLESKGYNYSLGLAQVNRANLGRYGLDSYQKAFDHCANLSAGAQILAGCYKSAGSDWGKAFSCYYSGNFTTGFHDGYVQKVYASISQGGDKASASTAHASQAIALKETSSASGSSASDASLPRSVLRPMTVFAPGSGSYRVALRSMAIDAAASAVVPAVIATSENASQVEIIKPNSAAASSPAFADATRPELPGGSSIKQVANSVTSAPPKPVPASGAAANSDAFIPQVSSPNDPPTATNSASGTAPAAVAQSSAVQDAGRPQETRDAAFVF